MCQHMAASSKYFRIKSVGMMNRNLERSLGTSRCVCAMPVCYYFKGESLGDQITHFTCTEESAQLSHVGFDLYNTHL
jgi:hypothetical protein